jgi:hypothetical protein
MNETLSIRHGQILKNVTGIDLKKIWIHLIDFVLWGAPDKEEDLDAYCLYWAWKAIIMLQNGEHFQAEHDGWASPDSITAEVLGWKLQDVLDKKPHTSRRHGWTPDSTLVRAVLSTVMLFIDQSDVPYADQSPKYPEVGQWYWYDDAPAYILDHRYLPLIEILVPDTRTTTVFVRSNDIPVGLDERPQYYTNWIKMRVPADKIHKVRLDKAKLEY